VTTLCSEETENINGLPAPSEMSLSGNFYRNPAQDALRTAYDNDGVYGFKVIFPSGMASCSALKFVSTPGILRPTVLLLQRSRCV
jgi:hypothetical protein